MEDRRAGDAPQGLARIGGLLYLIIIVLGLYTEMFVRDRLIVSGDAVATAARVRSMESLWRVGVACEMVMLLCATALALIFLVLLRPVHRDLAWLAIFFDLVSIAVQAAVAMYLLEALFPLGDAAYLTAFLPGQRYAMASLAIRSHAYGYGVSLIFFAGFCLVVGTLLFRSGYFPKLLGVLMQIAGVSYLINSFALLVAPGLADVLFPAILVPAFIGEASLCLWLLVKGVDAERWQARARAAAAGADAGR